MKKYYKFGYSRFGPFLYGFVRWLKNELVKKGYDKVFFFSRDGYMMKKAFELINDTGIQAEYAYFSRKSLRAPLLHSCTDFEDSLKYLSWERYISFGKLLEYYGFDKAESSDIAARGGFELGDCIAFDSIMSNAAARRIYEENRDTIISRSLEQDRLLTEYTRQLGMRGRFAIVDIGWHGNMQYYLEQFALTHGLGVQFEGFYIGIDPVKKLGTTVNGYLFDSSDMRNRKRLLCFFGGYEKLLQSFEGSASGYAGAEDGRIVPVLMPYEYEGDQWIQKAVKSWQYGALRFVKKACETRLADSDRQLTEPLIRFGMKPTVRDTELFSFFYITDGTKVYFTAQKPLFRYTPKEFLHALSDSSWKTGFMRSAFRLPLPYYQIYRLLRK